MNEQQHTCPRLQPVIAANTMQKATNTNIVVTAATPHAVCVSFGAHVRGVSTSHFHRHVFV